MTKPIEYWPSGSVRVDNYTKQTDALRDKPYKNVLKKTQVLL